jgi:hypothetical protein
MVLVDEDIGEGEEEMLYVRVFTSCEGGGKNHSQP